MTHFVCIVSIYACLRLIVIEEVGNYGKIVFIKNVVENGYWGEMHPPHPSPLDLSLLITCNSKNQCRLLSAVDYGLLKMKSFYLMKQIKIKSSSCSRWCAEGVTSGGAHLRGLAPGQHRYENPSQLWQAAGDAVPI